jgi:hypothetical protein
MKLQLSQAISMGSMIVPRPWSSDINRCAIGMALIANGILPHRVEVFRQLYPWVDKIFTCPWCENPNPRGASFLMPIPEYCLLGTFLVAHPFDVHVLAGQITLDELCRWIASIEPDPRFCGIAEDMIQEGARPVLASSAALLGEVGG